MPKEKEPEYNTEWSDNMVSRFLTKRTSAGEINDAEFDMAVYAYQFMLPDVFIRFLGMFKEHGFDLNAKNAAGQTVLQYISTHGRADEYIKALQEAGAQ